MINLLFEVWLKQDAAFFSLVRYTDLLHGKVLARLFVPHEHENRYIERAKAKFNWGCLSAGVQPFLDIQKVEQNNML